MQAIKRINGAGETATLGRFDRQGSGGPELSGYFATLYDLTHATAHLEFSDEVGEFGVWLEGVDDEDIIGSGASETEALEDAINTARAWVKS